MESFTRLLLFAAIASAGARRININEQTEKYIGSTNKATRQSGLTSANLPVFPFHHHISYSNGTVFGLDSLTRTGDCWLSYDNTSLSESYRYGYSFLSFALPKLTIQGKEMSASVRVRDNSIHFAYSVHREGGCRVTLDDLYVERLGQVEFGASDPDFDGEDLSGFFQSHIARQLNRLIDSAWSGTEEMLQALCNQTTTTEQGSAVNPTFLAFLNK